jgi:hypothetical protein
MVLIRNNLLTAISGLALFKQVGPRDIVGDD